jgi:hypothetical protein
MMTLSLDPHQLGSNTLYDIQLTDLDQESRNCRFTLDISESEPDQSPMSSAPIDGYAAWSTEQLVAAFTLSETGDVGVARKEWAGGRSGSDLDDAATVELARAIAMAVLTSD